MSYVIAYMPQATREECIQRRELYLPLFFSEECYGRLSADVRGVNIYSRRGEADTVASSIGMPSVPGYMATVITYTHAVRITIPGVTICVATDPTNRYAIREFWAHDHWTPNHAQATSFANVRQAIATAVHQAINDRAERYAQTLPYVCFMRDGAVADYMLEPSVFAIKIQQGNAVGYYARNIVVGVSRLAQATLFATEREVRDEFDQCSAQLLRNYSDATIFVTAARRVDDYAETTRLTLRPSTMPAGFGVAATPEVSAELQAEYERERTAFAAQAAQRQANQVARRNLTPLQEALQACNIDPTCMVIEFTDPTTARAPRQPPRYVSGIASDSFATATLTENLSQASRFAWADVPYVMSRLRESSCRWPLTNIPDGGHLQSVVLTDAVRNAGRQYREDARFFVCYDYEVNNDEGRGIRRRYLQSSVAEISRNNLRWENSLGEAYDYEFAVMLQLTLRPVIPECRYEIVERNQAVRAESLRSSRAPHMWEYVLVGWPVNGIPSVQQNCFLQIFDHATHAIIGPLRDATTFPGRYEATLELSSRAHDGNWRYLYVMSYLEADTWRLAITLDTGAARIARTLEEALEPEAPDSLWIPGHDAEEPQIRTTIGGRPAGVLAFTAEMEIYIGDTIYANDTRHEDYVDTEPLLVIGRWADVFVVVDPTTSPDRRPLIYVVARDEITWLLPRAAPTVVVVGPPRRSISLDES